MRLWVRYSRVVHSVACLVVGAMLSSTPAVAAESADAATPRDLVFEGVCDGSAGVVLDGGVLLVANDRSNWLYEFSLEQPGPPSGRLDLHTFTGVHPRGRRNTSAFEGFARIGDFVYVMSSHARERQGVNRPHRKRFFAVQVFQNKDREGVRVYGKAFHELAENIEGNENLKRISLRNAIMSQYIQLPYLAPSQSGLSIQGLAAAPDGQGLLLGLRNPLRGKSAIVLPLANPADVVVKFAAEPDFGEPILMNLEGRGISSIEYSAARSSYLIVAASKLSAPADYALFEWSGDRKSRPTPIEGVSLDGLRPEGLVLDADGKRALLLSDDGTRRVPVADATECGVKPKKGKCRCDELSQVENRSFRARWIDLPPVKPTVVPRPSTPPTPSTP